jgi:hypothetical protein
LVFEQDFTIGEKDMKELNEMLTNYDWQEAFTFADFTMEDVALILKASEGENDGQSWLAVGQLKNGLFFFLSAWCDYTGWDCQSGGQSEVADSLDNLIRWRMGDADRDRLGYQHPPEQTP